MEYEDKIQWLRRYRICKRKEPASSIVRKKGSCKIRS